MTALPTALRSLARHPAHSALIVAVFAAGATLALALFNVLDAFLWRDAGFPAAERVVHLVPERDGKRQPPPIPAGTALFLRDNTTSFAAFAFSRRESGTLDLGQTPIEVSVQRVNADAFAVLGVPARLGRVLTVEDERTGDRSGIVLSDSLWTERFARDSNVIGHRVLLDGREHLVLGMMPPLPFSWKHDGLWALHSFSGDERRSFFTPQFTVQARLRPGISLAVAQSDLVRARDALAAVLPKELARWTARLSPWREEFISGVRPFFNLLGGAALAAALLAALNATGLFLARLHARLHELAVRVALGADTRALTRPLALESALLAGAGVALGTLAAAALPPLLTRFAPDALPKWADVGFGLHPALAAAALAFGNTALLASEARRVARRAVNRESLTTSAIADRRVRAFQRLLVVCQLAVSFALAANTTLLVHSWQQVRHIDLGFTAEDRWVCYVRPPAERYDTVEKLAQLATALEQSLRATPGLRGAGFATTMPLTAETTTVFQTPTTPTTALADLPRAIHSCVSPGYFEALGLRLIAGRFFSEEDRAGGARVAIVSESLARQFYPKGDALNQWIVAVHPMEWRRIVGIVADVKQGSIRRPPPPQIYEPFAQVPRGAFTLFLRLPSATAALSEAAVRAVLQSVDPALRMRRIYPLSAYLDAHTSAPRLATHSLLTAAALAVLLALAGFGALLVLTTTQRTREFGVRLTLGATPRQIVALVVREGLLLAALGAAVGTLGAWTLGQAAQATLYGPPPPALATFGIASVTLLACVIAACALPAWRAARTDPAQCLRSE